MDKEVIRREVRGAIMGELVFKVRNFPSESISEVADQLTNAVMKRLEALDPTVLERPKG